MPEFCSCPLPSTSSDPRKPATHCGKCGILKGPEWDQNDENFAAFWERIEECDPTWKSKWIPNWEPSPESQTLRLQTTHRELAGRKHFGYAYLQRDNIREAREELADALLYVYLDTLKNVRDGDDPEWDVVLEIADDLLSAYGKLNQLKHKHRGVPA